MPCRLGPLSLVAYHYGLCAATAAEAAMALLILAPYLTSATCVRATVRVAPVATVWRSAVSSLMTVEFAEVMAPLAVHALPQDQPWAFFCGRNNKLEQRMRCVLMQMSWSLLERFKEQGLRPSLLMAVYLSAAR